MDIIFASPEHQQSGAVLLAYTAKSYMPIFRPIASHVYPWGFSVDFLFSGTFDETPLLLLTEEMRRNVAKNYTFQPLSMTPKNGYDYLKEKEPLLAEILLEKSDPLVELVKIADFYALVEHETVASTEECKEFALCSIEKKQAFFDAFGNIEVVQIQGAVLTSKKDVKKYVKAHALAKKFHLVDKAKSKNLVTVEEGHAIWYPEGIAFYEKVKSMWKNLCHDQGICEFLAPNSAFFDAHLRYLQSTCTKKACRSGQWSQSENFLLPQEYEGLFQTKEMLGDCIFRLCTKEALEDEFISSLQFIEKLHTIMGLDFGIVFICSKAKNDRALQGCLQGCMKDKGYDFSQEKTNEPNARMCVEYRVCDELGRVHVLSTIRVQTALDVPHLADKVLITQRSICSLERVLALLLWQNKWNLEDTKTLES